MQPIVLPANQPADRFYRGGEQIARFRGPEAGNLPASGVAERSLRVPEDWVASATTLFGEAELGLTRLPDDVLLRDAISEDPRAWLGPDHVSRFGDDVGVLVKLLDAGERLPVHAHPDRSFAREHLGLSHGKTEAWIALEPAEVGLGFARDVGADELADWVRTQDTEAMLGAMHRLQMRRGDAVLVPAGTPHAIGAGAFVVELQEPTDLSILMEWRDFAIDGQVDGHLNLGFGVALQAIDRRGRTLDEVQALVRGSAATRGPLLPGAENFFRADRLGAGDSWEAGFAVVIVTRGDGSLRTVRGEHAVRAGDTVVVPYEVGDVSVVGDLKIIVARPPAPSVIP